MERYFLDNMTVLLEKILAELQKINERADAQMSASGQRVDRADELMQMAVQALKQQGGDFSGK